MYPGKNDLMLLDRLQSKCPESYRNVSNLVESYQIFYIVEYGWTKLDIIISSWIQ